MRLVARQSKQAATTELSDMAESLGPSDLALQHSAARPSTTTQPCPATKRDKLAARQDGDSQGRKRTRGRPRLDMDPATVADRRRAQLRVAQRAYRDRKEGTLSTLEKRVQTLEKQQENLNLNLTGLYDEFLAQGLGNITPDLTNRLKLLVDQTALIADRHGSTSVQRSGSSGVDSQGAETSQEPPGPESREGASKANTTFSSSSQDDSFSSSSSSSAVMTHNPHANTYLPQDVAGSGFSMLRADSLEPVPIYIECMGWTASYAFREKTFGRRIQRIALEGANVMCHQLYPDPDIYSAIFGFCLLWESKDEIRERILSLVKRSASETLDDWSFPFPSLGQMGRLAATVPLEKIPGGMPGQPGYLPIGNYNTSVSAGQKDNLRTGPFMGPFSPHVESARDSYIDQQMHMLFPDFEGHFYDPNDTELYLRLRGIVIPEQADFITAEVNLDDFSTQDANFDQGGLPLDPSLHTNVKSETADVDIWRLSVLNRDGPGSLQAMLPNTFLKRVDWATASGDSIMFPPSNYLPSWEEETHTEIEARVFRGRKVKVSIDVNRLIAELIRYSVCLGRCPGVRPRHINLAVKMASAVLA